MPTTARSTSRDKVRAHRTRLRKAGLRPVQIWVPDVRSKSFAQAAHRQSLAVKKSPAADAGKPRPAVIVQDDRFDANDSIVVCPLTTDPTQAPIFRLSVQPSAQSGLRAPCRMMVDKLTAVPRRRLGRLVGSLASEEVKALNRAIFVFLGLAETEASRD